MKQHVFLMQANDRFDPTITTHLIQIKLQLKRNNFTFIKASSGEKTKVTLFGYKTAGS